MKKLSLAILLCLMISCGKDKVEPTVDTIDEAKIMQLVNDLRAKGCKCGNDQMSVVGKLTWNNQLEKAAARHSDDMKTNNFFDHTGSDGSNAGKRMSDAGYIWTMYGENIGKGYQNEDEVFNGWLTSGTHCKNMMEAAFTDFAVSRSGEYWTMVLGAK